MALIVIDHGRLQGAAWAEFHTARKRLDKATRDLRRHEEVDIPAYEAWLHTTFPLLVTTLRDLQAEIAAKARKIKAVQARAAIYGGSLKRIWRDQRAREASPAMPADDEASEDAEENDPEGEDSSGRRYEARPEDFEKASGPAPSLGAREIYRRLVQHLHPDRGGDWTVARQHLWHEVQQAWAAADADWLARLEVDWETAHEVVGPQSPLSRLRRGIEELEAARRDTERKLAEYRGSPPWRFTRSERFRPALSRRVEGNLSHDIHQFKRQLDHLNATIASWEEDWTRGDTRHKPRQRYARRSLYRTPPVHVGNGGTEAPGSSPP